MESYVQVTQESSVTAPVDEGTYHLFSSSLEDSTTSPAPSQHSSGILPSSLSSSVSSASQFESKHVLINDAPYTRTPAFAIEKLSGKLPHGEISPDVDHETVAASMIEQLNRFSSECFTVHALWRDLYALTGTFRTFNGVENIGPTWVELANVHHQSNFRLIEGSSKVIRMGTESSWIQARFSFETTGEPKTRCSGQIGIALVAASTWKTWLLTTILEDVKGFPSPDVMEPQVTDIKGFPNPDLTIPCSTSGNSEMTRNESESTQFDCVVVGAGYAGLCLTGRLQAMNINSVTLERNAHIGDNWTNRYDSARFHTSRDYSDMPLGRVFNPEDDYFLSAKDLARGYQDYAKQHNLNVWLSTTLKSASFDEDNKKWTLHIDRAGEESSIVTRHVIFAIGAGGSVPVMPQLPNRELYQGIVLHSGYYKNAHKWKGKTGVVIGTANTAHDVAEDMQEAGLASVTMVQRGRTPVFPVEYYSKWSDTIYNRTTPIEEADRQVMGLPVAITRQTSIFGNNFMASQEPERFDALERAGFRVERYGDLWKCLSERLGGQYIDVGASAKISAGLIKIKGDVPMVGFTQTGLEFSDGSTLDADVIVFCTGFETDVRKEVIKFVGLEIGDKLEDYWGLDDEGELRGAFKPLYYPGIWYAGGGITYARFYSRFIALYIKADISGVPLKVYRKKPVQKTGDGACVIAS